MWIWDPPGCETASYKGRQLRVRHIWEGEIGDTSKLFSIGYIDGQSACRCYGPMQRICELLFAEVDRLEAL